MVGLLLADRDRAVACLAPASEVMDLLERVDQDLKHVVLLEVLEAPAGRPLRELLDLLRVRRLVRRSDLGPLLPPRGAA